MSQSQNDKTNIPQNNTLINKRKLKHVTIIIENGTTLVINRHPTESKSTFLKRIDFHLKCIQYDLSPSKTETYTCMYINKLKYGVTYKTSIEHTIKKINLMKLKVEKKKEKVDSEDEVEIEISSETDDD